jgi:hypothetical protein
MAAVADRLGRFFGKRGAATVRANLSVITEAYDSVIHVTGALAGPNLPAPRELMEARR